MEHPIVAIQDLCYSSGGIDILHDISLTVNKGDFISVVGPNGGGKTTLLKIILGLLRPTRGRVLIDGDPPRSRSTVIGYVPQYVNHNLSFPVTALDVVLMGAHDPRHRLWHAQKKNNQDHAMQVLKKLGIEELAQRKIYTLSGGQRQRVLIARALVSNPELLILDEPTASIDTKGRTEFYDLLKVLNQELTILMVSHDLMIVSSYAKSMACLNKRLHYHQSFDSSGDVLDAYYSCSVEECCPVGVIAQAGQHQQKDTKSDL